MSNYSMNYDAATGHYTTTEYTPIAVPTPEEIRLTMPNLTSRQFWMAAASIDIDKNVLVNLIKAVYPEGVDRKMMIAELETSSFERNNVTVVELMELMEITPEQADDLWMWATGI